MADATTKRVDDAIRETAGDTNPESQTRGIVLCADSLTVGVTFTGPVIGGPEIDLARRIARGDFDRKPHH